MQQTSTTTELRVQCKIQDDVGFNHYCRLLVVVLPSSRQKVDFDKGVRQAVDVPGLQVPSLYNVDVEVACQFVMTELQLNINKCTIL